MIWVSSMSRNVDIAIGAAVRESRIHTGLTELQVARAIGIGKQQLQKYEKGENRLPVSRLAMMSRKCGIDAHHVLLIAERTPTN